MKIYIYNLGFNNNQMAGSQRVSNFYALSDCKNVWHNIIVLVHLSLMLTRNILLANFAILMILLVILSMNLYSLNIGSRYNSIVSPMN
jgi:hypothetical protein